MKKGFIYARVSTSKQDFQRQIDDIKKYCEYHEIKIQKTFTETMSGAKEKRPELTHLINVTKKERPDYIIVSELSRLGRTNEILNTIKTFNELNVCLISLKENLRTLTEDLKPDGYATFLTNVWAGVNQMELETTKYRVKSGLKKAISNGHWRGGRLPYGYTKEDKKLKVEDKEKDLIKEIFKRYLDGYGAESIATYLNSSAWETRTGKRWSSAVVYRILTNTIYIGKGQFKDTVYKSPQIINENTFNQVQKILKKNSINLV